MIKIKDRIAIVLILFIFLVQFCESAQDQELESIKRSIRNEQTLSGIDIKLAELFDIYKEDNKLDEFYVFLEDLEKDKSSQVASAILYCKALVKFSQLQYLEENKLWEEFFANKGLYLSEINSNLEQAKKLSVSDNKLSLKIKFLEWQLNKEDNNVAINILEDLFNLAQGYSGDEDGVAIIKDIADTLAETEQSTYAKKLYNVYVSKVSESDIGQEELKKLAEEFLVDEKYNLSISLYDAYVDKLMSNQKDKNIVMKEMFDIAEKFANSGWQEGLDPFYAEKIYEKIENTYKKDAFSAMAQYKRAYNLERLKEYDSCVKEYLKLVNNFLDYKDKDRIYFRLGVINAYILNDTDKARGYLLKVANDYANSIDYLNSLYHLGLLSQAQNDPEKAIKYYLSILEATKDFKVKPDIANLAESRVDEIVEEKDVEYNLRVFLETVLKIDAENKFIHLELYAKAAKDYLDENIKFQTNSYFLETGCLQQDFTYLWSGQLGSNQNPFNELEFDTSYEELGTKVINVVLVDPSGPVDGTIEIADIYEQVAEKKEN
ncbi:MAG: tetratricopeptide repeat protein [Candidatus Omnitrophota bacterium]